MATLGVVSYANVNGHNKLQILQHSANSNQLGNNNNNSERREIIILRKKPKIAVVNEVKQQQLVSTAPTTVLVSNNNGRARKRPPCGGGVLSRPQQPPPVAVARRNARERNRVKQVNNGFATLRQHIPPAISAAYASHTEAAGGRAASKKLSKVETLRMAVDYIRSLQQLLDETDTNNASNSSIESSASYLSPTPSNSPSKQQNPHHQAHYSYEDDAGRSTTSPAILLEDEDDSSIMDPTSPEQANQYGSNQLSQLVVTPAAESHKTFPGAPHVYEVDENMAPVTVSPGGGALYQQTVLSLSPGAAQDGARGPAFLPAIPPLPPLAQLPASLASLVHHGYHALQFPFKREEVNPDIASANADMIDMMTWWEQEQRVRQQTAPS